MSTNIIVDDNVDSFKLSLVGESSNFNTLIKKLGKKSNPTQYKNVSELLNSKQRSSEVVILSEEKITRKAIQRITVNRPLAAIAVLVKINSRKNFPHGNNHAITFVDQRMSKNAIRINLQCALRVAEKRNRLQSLEAFLNSHSDATCQTLKTISESTWTATVPANYHDMTKSLLRLMQRIGVNRVLLVSSTDTGQVLTYESCKDVNSVNVEISNSKNLSALNKLTQSVSIVNSTEHAHKLGNLTDSPWAYAMVFKYNTPAIEGNELQQSFLVSFRQDLEGFNKNEIELASIMYSIIGLGLQKVAILNYNHSAARDWSDTFDSISEPLSIINKRYEIVRANKAFSRAVGKHITKLPGRKCYSLFSQRNSKCKNCLPISKSISSIPIKVDGRRNQKFYVWSYPIKTSNREVQRIHFYRNISVEHQLTTTLIQSERMQAIGDLLTAVSHEINNPLTGIISTVQVMLAENKKNVRTELYEDLQEIENSALRAVQIIDNLLGFGDNSTDSACSVEEGISSVIKFSKSSLRSIDLELDIDKELSDISVSRSSFQQILFNIITNASNAMSANGNLKILAKNKESSFIIHLEDNGKGMSKKTIQQIFEPFFTQKNKGRGTGLGMVIVKDLVNRMNGSIKINSTLGTGTSIQLQFPKTVEA